MISLVGPALLDIAVNGRAQEAFGWRSQEAPAAPHGVYRCRPRGDDDDRWIAISRAIAGRMGALRRALSAIPSWAAEPRFRTLYLRMRNSDELDTHVARWAADQEAEAAMALLQRAGIAAGVALNGDDLCERDPQLAERGFLAPVKLPDGDADPCDGRADAAFGDAGIGPHAVAVRGRRGQRLRPGRATGAWARRTRGTDRRGRSLGLITRAARYTGDDESVQIHQSRSAVGSKALLRSVLRSEVYLTSPFSRCGQQWSMGGVQ